MILSAKDISQKLADRVQSVVEWLLPNGKLSGGEWCAGSVGGESGKSLKVRVSGERAGVWADFAGVDKGDLIDLIAAVKQVPIGDAIRIAKEWLGISDPVGVIPRKEYKKPEPRNVSKPKPDSRVLEYLTQDRKLDIEAVRRFRISEANGGLEIAFPSFSPAGDLLNVKYVAVKRDENGKKITHQEGGCAPSMFGWQALRSGVREVVITEGEIDAITWSQMGFDALSVPMGAGNHQWIDWDWDNLQQFDTIYLSYDDDAAGKEGVAKVASRLGIHRCMITRLDGYKDANEALQAGAGMQVFNDAITSAKPISPDQIKTPMAYRDRVQSRFYPPEGVQPGYWPNIFNRQIGFRAGETTLWSGISGHGKSTLLGQVMLAAVHVGERVAVASMEMRGEHTLHKIICQAEDVQRPTPRELDDILRWLSGKLWIYDIFGNVAPKRLLELMEYSVARHGVTHFVIDSLMKCAVGSEDYDAQRVFMNDLCTFAASHECHIHIVAHPRKGRDENESPGKLDIKGSSDIINQPDNILIVYRNKEKEQRRAARKLSEEEDKQSPDAIVYCNKQRETGVEFEQKLWFYRPIFKYVRFGFEEGEGLSILRKIKYESKTQDPQ